MSRDESDPIRRLARAIYRRSGIATAKDLLLLSYGRRRLKRILAETRRSQSHLFTCCYRSPDQIAALTGPVMEFLSPDRKGPLRVHVFACSTGAEAYTVASSLLAHFPDLDFEVHASDLHAETVEKGRSGRYTAEEVGRNGGVPADFLARTFDAADGDFLVKPEIRARVSFSRADLLDAADMARFEPADLVFAQNVFIHLDREQARAGFENVLRTLKPRAVLYLDGMELDLRARMTARAGLQPLNFRVRSMYEFSRRFSPQPWWEYYWGREPYWPFGTDPVRRYASIFLKGG